MTEHQITDAEYATALSSGRAEAASELRAQAVRYIPERDAIEIVTNQEGGFLIPRTWIGALQEVPPDELAKLEIWPDGSAIGLEERDIHISVDGLLLALLPIRNYSPRISTSPSITFVTSAVKIGNPGQSLADPLHRQGSNLTDLRPRRFAKFGYL
jgi:hypothetical protein